LKSKFKEGSAKMKRILLALLALMALVSIPATVFAEDKDPTPWQYKDHFIKMEALIDEDAEASYDRFMKFVKIEDRYQPKTESLPDGTEFKFYKGDDKNSGLYASTDGKTIGLEIKSLSINGVLGYLEAVNIEYTTELVALLADPSNYEFKTAFVKNDKIAVGITPYEIRDKKGSTTVYKYGLMIFKDLDFYEKAKKIYDAENKE